MTGYCLFCLGSNSPRRGWYNARRKYTSRVRFCFSLIDVSNGFIGNYLSPELPVTMSQKYFQFTAARLLHLPSFIYHTLPGKILHSLSTIQTLRIWYHSKRSTNFDHRTHSNINISTLNKRLLWSPLPALLVHDELRTNDRTEQKPQ